MDAADWTDAEAIFAAALEVAPAERATLLNARCGDRAELRSEVESLLASHDRAGEFLDAPAIDTAVNGGAGDDRTPGRRVPPRRADRPGRNGGRLPRRACDERVHAASRGQADRGAAPESGDAAALQDRAADPRRAASSAHRHAARRRREPGRLRLPRDGVRRGGADHRPRRRARAAARRAAAVDAARLQRRAVRAPARRGAPRSEARQHPGHRRRRAQGARFWRGEAPRSVGAGRTRSTTGWSVATGAHAQLREPGTVARAAGDDGLRHLRAGRAALRASRRRAAVRDCRQAAGRDAAHRHGRRAAPAERGRGRRRSRSEPGATRRPRRDRAQGDEQGAGAALCVRAGAVRGSRPLPRAATGRGPRAVVRLRLREGGAAASGRVRGGRDLDRGARRRARRVALAAPPRRHRA